MRTTPTPQALSLIVRRVIATPPTRLFEAWTQPEQVMSWWGPRNVACVDATIEARAGGRYRIGNRFPDGRVVWIVGEFEVVEPPHRLVYSWRLEPGGGPAERVTVRFEPRDKDRTELIVIHERIVTIETRDQHELGWHGCLEGLERFLMASSA